MPIISAESRKTQAAPLYETAAHVGDDV